MPQDRTQDRTRTAGVQMQQDGMPQGQAPARQPPQRPLTAAQKAAEDAKAFRVHLISQVEGQRPMIEGFLRVHGVDWDFFVAALKVGLEGTMKNDRDFFDPHDGVTLNSFLDAVVRCSKDGLMPDGKQAAIARFKRVATYMPMVEGFCHILYQTGMVRDINHNVVRDCDDIEFQEGDDGYVKHRRPLKRPPQAETIGAWCVINLTTGGKIVEVCDDKDLADIAKVSRATKGPRVDWQDEMHRKGPFRRAIKRAPKNPRLAQLISHDDMNYDLSRGTGGERVIERTTVVPKEALFSDKAAVKKPKEQPALEAPSEEPMKAVQASGDGHPDLPDAISAILHSEDAVSLGQAVSAARQLKPLTEDEIAWIGETEAAQREKLGIPNFELGDQDDEPQDADFEDAGEDDAPFQLTAIITSSAGPKAYDSAEEWKGAILNKLSALNAKAAQAFARTNLPFIRAAAEHHPDEAGKVMRVMTERGLVQS